MEVSLYTVQVFDKDRNLLADLSAIQCGLSVQKVRNDTDVLRATVSLDGVSAYASALGQTVSSLVGVGRNELRISKGSTVLAAGRVMSARRFAADSSRTLVLSAIGWFGLLARAYTANPIDYSDGLTDGGTIALAFLADAQAQAYGDLGITAGIVQASSHQAVIQNLDKCVKDAISEISSMQGSFDFEVTWDRKLNIYAPQIGSLRPDIPLTFPGNVKGLTLTTDGTSVVNHLIANGSGRGFSGMRTTSDNTGSQMQYDRMSKPISMSDVTDMDQLQSRSDGYLQAVNHPISIPEPILDGVRGPDVTQIVIGDSIPYIIGSEEPAFAELDGNYYRVESMEWTVDSTGIEELKLTQSA